MLRTGTLVLVERISTLDYGPECVMYSMHEGR